MFPQRLDSPLAYQIAQAMLDGFNRHYRLFRSASAQAKQRFEAADWHGQQRAQRERIEFYDLRVREAVQRLETEFNADEQPMDVWHQVKLHYIGLLIDHHQPELAETFFNTTTSRRPGPPTARTTRPPTRCTRTSCASSPTSSCAVPSRTWTVTRAWCWMPWRPA
jgi:hypothetical protein